jgi:hypothetical protein
MSDFVFLNKTDQPENDQILNVLSEAKSLWLSIHEYVGEMYYFIPELVYFTKKYGWTIRYRRHGTTLCYFFPKSGYFSILIILGQKEAEQIELVKESLNENVRNVFENTQQLHDGRWLWVDIRNLDDISSFKLLLTAKKKPKSARVRSILPAPL